MGCVAIWPVTVLKRSSHREVEMLSFSEENFLNPGKKAQNLEDVDAQFASVA